MRGPAIPTTSQPVLLQPVGISPQTGTEASQFVCHKDIEMAYTLTDYSPGKSCDIKHDDWRRSARLHATSTLCSLWAEEMYSENPITEVKEETSSSRSKPFHDYFVWYNATLEL
jgi:hypothetical protein